MRKFHVEVYEIHASTYEVDAENEVSACEIVNDAGGELIASDGYLFQAEDIGMPADDLPDDLIDRFIDAGLLKEDGFVSGIRSIKEVEE